MAHPVISDSFVILDNIAPLVSSPTMGIRWMRRKTRRGYELLLQQAWRAEDGSIVWHRVEVVDSDE